MKRIALSGPRNSPRENIVKGGRKVNTSFSALAFCLKSPAQVGGFQADVCYWPASDCREGRSPFPCQDSRSGPRRETAHQTRLMASLALPGFRIAAGQPAWSATHLAPAVGGPDPQNARPAISTPLRLADACSQHDVSIREVLSIEFTNLESLNKSNDRSFS